MQLERLVQQEARNSLAIYTSAVHRTDEGRPAIPPPHILKHIIPVLENDSLGNTVIVAPPGSAKTVTAIAATCWWIGKHTNDHFAFISNTHSQAVRRSVAIRDLIEQSPDYRTIFPHVHPDKTKGWAENEWYLDRPDRGDKDPTMLAMGVGGPLLGARIDRGILDDIADSRNMATREQQTKVIDWLERTFMTRITPRGRVVMICTRWAENDPANWAIKQGWHYVRIPAVDDNWNTYWPGFWPINKLACPDNKHDSINGYCFDVVDSQGRRQRGHCRKKLLSSRSFTQQYQAEVVDDDSALIKRHWWKYYNVIPSDVLTKNQGGIFVDTAHQVSNMSDYSVALVMQTDGVNFYVTDLLRARLEFPELERALLTLRAKYPRFPIVVELTTGSLPLLQSLKRKVPLVFPWKIQGRDKMARIESVVAYIEAGNVYLPENAPWTHDFVEECALFPQATHDDQVDGLSMALLSYTRPTVRFGAARPKDAASGE